MEPQIYAQALQNAGNSAWHYDILRDVFTCNDPAYQLPGMTDGVMPHFFCFLRSVVPEGTCERFLARVARTKEGTVRARVRTNDGAQFLTQCRGIWQQGRLTAVSGTFAPYSGSMWGEAFPDISKESNAAVRPVLQGTDDFARRLQMRLCGESGCVMQMNLEDFGAVNDCYGYELGDELLNLVSQFLYALLHEDAADAGGGRFWLFLPEPCSPLDVQRLLRPLTERFCRPWIVGSQSVYVNVSIGAVTVDQGVTDIRKVLSRAEMAAGEARGGNEIRFFEESMHTRVHHRMEVERDLRAALAEDRFQLYYQPQINPFSGRIGGVEALLRWVAPDERCILPPEFIPVAEKTGLIQPIGEWALDTACRQVGAWGIRPGQNFSMAVNLSPRQFAHADLANSVARILRETDLDPHMLELEITEQAVINDMAHAADTLGRLRDMGVQVALDDFGTGYSSLNYLRQLPIQKLKIDRSFVTDIVGKGKERVIAGSIIRMAHDLMLTVVAEGVEDTEQCRILQEQGCDLIQGYLFSRPVPQEHIRSMLAAEQR